MNLYRLAGDLLHLLAIIILLLKILKTRSCAGISGRSQILFALVYTTRYLDLFSYVISTYNSVMKVIFIGATYATLFLVYVKFEKTYSRNRDTFRIEFLVIPVAILAYIINHNFDRLEVLWTFSIYLESVAILPQLLLVLKSGKAETIISVYLSCLGSYRALYILNWIYRYYSQGFYDLIAIIAGVVQTAIYSVFFCLYTTKDWSGWTDIMDTVSSDRNDELKQCKILVKSDLAVIDATPFLKGYKNGYEPLQEKKKAKQVPLVHKTSGVPYEMLLSDDDPMHSPCMTSSDKPMSENHSLTKVIVLDKAEIKETGNPDNLIKE